MHIILATRHNVFLLYFLAIAICNPLSRIVFKVSIPVIVFDCAFHLRQCMHDPLFDPVLGWKFVYMYVTETISMHACIQILLEMNHITPSLIQ